MNVLPLMDSSMPKLKLSCTGVTLRLQAEFLVALTVGFGLFDPGWLILSLSLVVS